MREFYSPYTGMGNNPISRVDPTGGYSKFGAWWRSGFSSDIYKSGDEWGYNTYKSSTSIYEGKSMQEAEVSFHSGKSSGSSINDWAIFQEGSSNGTHQSPMNVGNLFQQKEGVVGYREWDGAPSISGEYPRPDGLKKVTVVDGNPISYPGGLPGDIKSRAEMLSAAGNSIKSLLDLRSDDSSSIWNSEHQRWEVSGKMSGGGYHSHGRPLRNASDSAKFGLK
jgi:hypothetical protein